ncbi:seed imbibition 1-like, raffinose synthase 5 [Hibiscus trionum]|nr:seed imbibition 1-like, raffinose synthase 5 [Hibiscus trionum]
MFQSTHPCANFRAISREISSCPVYNSEAGINHNFSLMLKQFVLPDGSILRCRYNALPIKDCFIEDPLHEGKTMLKIMNLNKFDGVTGAFNCQDNFLHIE